VNVGDLVRYRTESWYNEQAHFLVVGKSSYNRLQLLKADGKIIEIHPDWLEVVNASR
jgi:hypothetical protein